VSTQRQTRAAGGTVGPTGPRIRLAVLAAALAVTASGCVSLQANGPITSVNEEGDGSSQVQIWPSPPSAAEAPSTIVAGFLEAAQSGAANLAIADDYLTAAMQKRWGTEQNTVIVLADDSESYPQPPGQDSGDSGDAQTSGETADNGPNDPYGGAAQNASSAEQVTVNVQGDLLGTLDSSGLYSASNGTETYSFGLTETKAGYRIAALPPDFGVLLERSDFESDYDRHDVFYENAQYPQELIPAQVYLPGIDTDEELATAMTRLVVGGVPDQLGSALLSPTPGAVFKSVEFDGDGGATVTINSKGYCAKTANACAALAQTLAQTLSSLSTKVAAVTIVDQANGQSYPPVPVGSGLDSYGLDQGSRPSGLFYAVTSGGGIESVGGINATGAQAMTFGDGKTKFSAIAVGPSGQGSRTVQFGLVSQDGTKVYVSHRQNGAYALTQVYPGSPSAAGGTVTGLSWDDYGVLWFTAKVGTVTSVYRYGQGDLSAVSVSGLAAGDQVTQVAAAPDGVRVAVGFQDQSGDSLIDIAAASANTDGNWSLQLGGAEAVAADWDQIKDFDWYNEDSLAVLGIQPNSQALGLYQIYADGSSVYDSLTEQPVEASPPSNAAQFVWNSGGDPIASAVNGGKEMLYELSVEGQDAQEFSSGILGTSPSY
jgi:hypothetical protein